MEKPTGRPEIQEGDSSPYVTQSVSVELIPQESKDCSELTWIPMTSLLLFDVEVGVSFIFLVLFSF